jgi:hypothetical protein
MNHLVLRCWWLSLVFVSACFSPQFQDGQIMCGPNNECPPGLECFGGVCRADDPGPDASTGFPLTITLGGNMMGTVTSAPTGINCGTDCTETFASGTMVTLTATPNSGSTFVGWSGACSGTGACTITVSTAVNVTANFAVDNSLVVTLAGNGSGIVSSNPAGINCGTACMYQFPPSTMVTLTALTATGSQFDGWSGGGCTGVGTCVVTADTAKMVTATFSLTQSTLTVALGGNGTGTVASNPTGINCGTDCTEAYSYNSMVTLTATPATGSVFSQWTGGACNGSTNATCTVTVTQAVTVTANFTLTQHALTVVKAGNGAGTVTTTPAGINCGTDCAENFDYNTMVTLSATPSAGSTFAGWSGGGCSGTSACTVTLTAANTVTATFTLNAYALTIDKSGNGAGTVASNPAGIDCGMDCSQSFDYNTMVTLTATAATGSTFTGWSGGGCTGTGTCTVTLTAATTVTATFTLNQHTLTVTKSGNGEGTVSGLGISCGLDCTDLVDYNTQITLTATPLPGSTFDGWSGGGCTGTGTCQVTITQATMVTASFTLSQHLLTVAKAGTGAGNVTSNLAGLNCGTDCNELVNYGTTVTLTAAPTTGSTFGGWSGGGCTGTMLMCTTTVNAATTVTATFTLTTQTLTVAANGGNGTGNVSSSPAGINCGNGGTDCTEPYNYGTQVTLSAAPAANSSFTGWSGTGINCPGTGTCTVDMTAARNVTATFTLGSQSLTVTKPGTGTGTVTSNPMGINCGLTCSGTFTVGNTVVLTATAAAGSTFTGWSGGGCTGTGTCSVVIPAGGVTVSATFTLDVHTLSVTKIGTGGGIVNSTEVPPRINCGLDCNDPYNYGSTVTLVATPDPNAVFMGWSGGGCTGTGTCTVTVTAATTVSASFDLVQRSLTVKPGGAGTGVVTSSPVGINCGADCDELYTDGQTVMLTPTPDMGSTFFGWSGDCTMLMGNICIVTMDANKVVYPDFDLASHELTVSTNIAGAGDVFSTTDPGIDCGADCRETYPYNTFVSLKASPNSGYTFTGWSGGSCTGTGTCDITMDMARNVIANFVVTTHTLTVNNAGTGTGTVTSNPTGISCGLDCTESYNEGTMVQLTPTAATGSTFTSWAGCTSQTGTTCNVTMDAAKNVTATFTIQQFSLNLNKTGSTGTGTVSFSPGTLVCGPTCSSASASYVYNTMATLTATPAVGSTFAGWQGACTNTTGTCQVTMTQTRNVTAVFTAIPANKVFVSSTSYTATQIASIANADMTCKTLATNAGLGGTTWRAFLSSPSSNITDRLGAVSGWVRTDGRPFANTKADLLSGNVYSPPRTAQDGTNVGNVTYLTGTTTNGVYSGAGDCTNFTGTGNMTVGRAASGSFMAINDGTATCGGATFRLLCIQADNQAVVVPPTPPTGSRRAFMMLWGSGTGIAGADSECAMHATSAGLLGTFRALLPTSTGSALSRFDTSATATNWYRVDGMPILPTAQAWTTATSFDSGPNLSANGVTTFGNRDLFSGAGSLTAAASSADTCAFWTASTTPAVARVGIAGFTPLSLYLGTGATASCAFGNVAVTCLQQ